MLARIKNLTSTSIIILNVALNRHLEITEGETKLTEIIDFEDLVIIKYKLCETHLIEMDIVR
ncbi:hypothetical protein NVP1020O_02 [Vibrio phage 1.020.O._10N.222.48.A2]|uniref:Uncharacterized protein n=1 Tax=Vibrio phage 1.020.O._10N.222.48.A2 TaxID=1881450 RepID=A0A2I7QKX4_9VIRU|nr:hypothetical protein KMD66_gp02 [Vibrio phage 1.020.O._10N.222.48.A2]AUR82044.1 hypothetical protein NVP1020O_02 [Vibrio phage 1.020.O._10N.222.48.A2]